MQGLVYFGGIVTVIATINYVYSRRNRPKDMRWDDVPEDVRDALLRRVPELHVERVVTKPNRYTLRGVVGGEPIQIKVRQRGGTIVRIQFQLETRSAHRSLKGKRLIGQKQVPRDILKKVRDVAESYGAPLEELSRIKAATVQGRNAFDVRGWSGDWRVEVELLDDGQVLEVELDYRPNR